MVGDSSSAMKIAAVFRCVDILSKELAQLPLGLYRKHSDGHFEYDPESFGLSYLVGAKPNDRMTAFEMMRSAMVLALHKGAAFITWDQSSTGEYLAFYLHGPGNVVYDKFTNVYHINDPVNAIVCTKEASEVIHIKNIGLDGGYTGVGTIQYAGQILAISSNADLQNVQTFKNGGLVSGFVTGKSNSTVGFGQVQDAQLDAVAKRIDSELASGKKIFNLPGEMSFNSVSLSPADIQLLQTKEFNVLEVCRFFGVHPDKVFAQQGGNYKASEMSQVAFLTDTLQPWLTQIEQEFSTKLLPRSIYNDYRIRFDIEPLMTTDLATKAKYMADTIAIGVRTVNDWRIATGKSPIDNGDTPLVSANLIELGSKKLRGE